MRNSGGSTDNIGRSAEKFELDPPYNPASRRPSDLTSPLRGADVIDAEFEHVDDRGHSIPSRPPVRPMPGPRARQASVDFDDGRSGQYRRLDMFSDRSRPAGRRLIVPASVLAVAVAGLSLGGLWFAGPDPIGTMPAGLPISAGSMVPDTVPDDAAPVDAARAPGTAGIQPPPVLALPPATGEPAGRRTEGSLIYVRTPKAQPAAGPGESIRAPVSAPVRSHRDLTVSLAGGSTGR